MQVGLLAACLVPLIVCFLVLRGLRDEATDGELHELLVQEFVADEPLLLPTPTAPPVPRVAGTGHGMSNVTGVQQYGWPGVGVEC